MATIDPVLLAETLNNPQTISTALLELLGLEVAELPALITGLQNAALESKYNAGTNVLDNITLGAGVTYLDTGWQSLVDPNYINTVDNWVQYDTSDFPCVYRKIGDIVFLRGFAKNTNPNNTISKILIGLPSFLTPTKNFYMPFVKNTGIAGVGYIANDGSLYISGFSTTWTSIACSYVVN